MSRKLITFVSLSVLLSMILAACGQATTAPTVEPALPAATEAPAVAVATEISSASPTAAPTTAPKSTRTGAWVDKLVFTSIDEAPNAIAQIQADALDIYSFTVQNADSFAKVKADSNLSYTMSYGVFDSILFNQNKSKPTFADGRLNPFSNRKIREAMNWLIDREYMVQEAVGGMGVPKTTAMIQAFPDYALYADLIRPIENKYAYNLDKAREVVKTEMETMGASMGPDGKWQYEGKPVVLIGLIRSEDERKIVGEYFANQLETIGFTVDRQVRTRSELAPIWQQSVTDVGEWSWYTAGNYYPGLVRNSSNFFAEFYTGLVASTTAEEAFDPSPELNQVATDLYNNKYASMVERRTMFEKALNLSVENSAYVFVFGNKAFYPQKADLEVASDLSSGIPGSAFWPLTIRWKGQEGGTVRSASSGILTGPWNPQAGHNWAQELYIIRATQDAGALSDPYTGLYWPQRIEKAEVIAKEGSPIQATQDWVDLKFEKEIKVPADAWVDWDAKAQKFITAAEKFPEGTTAVTKVIVTYPADMFKTIKWHDGSPLSVADFVFNMISVFDNGKPDSPIFDQANQSNVEALLQHFKGVKILSNDPLVIETYDDRIDLDAENLVGNYFTSNWFPVTNTGPQPWHTYVLGLRAEENKELAFSSDKSTALSVEWTNYNGGPSLEILKKYLDLSKSESYLPYAATMSQFVKPDEAAARYTNLDAWYAKYNHFWVGSGPFFVSEINSTEGSIVLDRNPDFPDPADKWSIFGTPKISIVDASGPAQVTQGSEAVFDALVTFDNAPYPKSDLSKVIYMLYDATGNMVGKGDAEYVADGQYTATLAAEVTKSLVAGSAKIEFVAVSTVVSIPTFAPFQFVVTTP
jgi:peptide/nickel transport system substrate-binding protein